MNFTPKIIRFVNIYTEADVVFFFPIRAKGRNVTKEQRFTQGN